MVGVGEKRTKRRQSQAERMERTEARTAKLMHSRAKKRAEQEQYDRAHRPWNEALAVVVGDLLGATYGPVFQKKQQVWVIDEQEQKAAVAQGIISKRNGKRKAKDSESSWDIEFPGVDYAYAFPAWSIFQSQEDALMVLDMLYRVSAC